jgi:hypothetical protein
MASRSKPEDPIKGVLGRLVIARMKGTGTRLSAAQVRALAPLFLEAIRSNRGRQSGEVTAKKPPPKKP